MAANQDKTLNDAKAVVSHADAVVHAYDCAITLQSTPELRLEALQAYERQLAWKVECVAKLKALTADTSNNQ